MDLDTVTFLAVLLFGYCMQTSVSFHTSPWTLQRQRTRLPFSSRKSHHHHYLTELQTKRAHRTLSPERRLTNNNSSTSEGSSPGWLRRTFPRFPWSKLPDALTMLRCLAIPCLILSYVLPFPRTTAATFMLASFTDWLDGYLARRWDATSAFGAFLDPVADKLMVATVLILMTASTPIGEGNIQNVAMMISTNVIIGREIAVSALREWMANRGKRDVVQVGMQGKIKTALTMVSLTILLLARCFTSSAETHNFLHLLGTVLLHGSAVVTVTSGYAYFRAAAPLISGSESV